MPTIQNGNETNLDKPDRLRQNMKQFPEVRTVAILKRCLISKTVTGAKVLKLATRISKQFKLSSYDHYYGKSKFFKTFRDAILEQDDECYTKTSQRATHGSEGQFMEKI